jgi:hypothetical protein
MMSIKALYILFVFDGMWPWGYFVARTLKVPAVSSVCLLTDPRLKQNAQTIGETFRNSGGMKKAADEIETLLEKGCNEFSPHHTSN